MRPEIKDSGDDGLFPEIHLQAWVMVENVRERFKAYSVTHRMKIGGS